MGGFERTRNASPVVRYSGDAVAAASPTLGRPAPTPEPQRLNPKAMGFTGNTCSNCQGIHMIIAGHCEVCVDCGTTTGCS